MVSCSAEMSLRNQVHTNGWDMKQLSPRYFSERLEIDKDNNKLD